MVKNTLASWHQITQDVIACQVPSFLGSVDDLEKDDPYRVRGSLKFFPYRGRSAIRQFSHLGGEAASGRTFSYRERSAIRIVSYLAGEAAGG